jgi:hypothetical protein
VRKANACCWWRATIADTLSAEEIKNVFFLPQGDNWSTDHCEGAGELFRVTTFDLEGGVSSLPVEKTKDGKGFTNKIDSSQDFFVSQPFEFEESFRNLSLTFLIEK